MGRTAHSVCGERSRVASGRVVAYAMCAAAYALAGDAPFPWRHPSGLRQRRVSPQWSLYHLPRYGITPHSTLILPLESLDYSPSPQSGGTADTLPIAVPGGRFTHWMSCSIHGGRPHVTTRQRVERCSMLSLIGMRECSTLNRDAYAREPCLRRSLRALRLKADAVAWSSLRCVMSSCAQHLYTHLHS